MTSTNGNWLPPVPNAIPNQTIIYNTPPTPSAPSRSLSAIDDRDLFVIHAALLHTGKVLWFSGHTEGMHYATASFVFDPDTGTLTQVPFPPDMDLFCCHFVQLEDGRLLTVGGSEYDYATHGSAGARNIALFDPTPSAGFPMGRWIDTHQKLLQGRWYPTAVLLGDGRVLVFSGRLHVGGTNPPANIANMVEVLSPPNFKPPALTMEEVDADFQPRALTMGGVDANFQLPLYPGLHLAPNGRIYYTHTKWGQEIDEPTPRALRLTGLDAGVWETFPESPIEPRRREEGMSVLLPLLPPAQDGKILVVGGSLARNDRHIPVLQPGGGGTAQMHEIADSADPTRATILNTSATGPPTWDHAPTTGTTHHGRINGHLVLLPDATVLVCGGHNHYKWHSSSLPLPPSTIPPTIPSTIAEIFTPSGPEKGFRPVAKMTHPRMYHSAALLLPDGRVIVAGGADANDPVGEPRPAGWPSDPASGWPARLLWRTGQYALNRKEHEIYEPPYFFYPGTRPEITGVTPRQLLYGSTFVVTTPQAAAITQVALMRPGCSTHHTDSEQRFVPLEITSRTANSLTVRMVPATDGLQPPQSATAPPGYYMLWIADTVSIDVGGGTLRQRLRPCRQAVFVQIPARMKASTSLCPIALLGTVAMVVALRDLRHELETTTAVGRRFIRIVNRLYYSFSPRLAAWLAHNERPRRATRNVIVRPAVAAVRAAALATAPIAPVGVRHAVLMVLLVLLATLGVVMGPLATLLLIAHVTLQRHPRHGLKMRRGKAAPTPRSGVPGATDEGERYAG